MTLRAKIICYCLRLGQFIQTFLQCSTTLYIQRQNVEGFIVVLCIRTCLTCDNIGHFPFKQIDRWLHWFGILILFSHWEFFECVLQFIEQRIQELICIMLLFRIDRHIIPVFEGHTKILSATKFSSTILQIIENLLKSIEIRTSFQTFTWSFKDTFFESIDHEKLL